MITRLTTFTSFSFPVTSPQIVVVTVFKGRNSIFFEKCPSYCIASSFREGTRQTKLVQNQVLKEEKKKKNMIQKKRPLTITRTKTINVVREQELQICEQRCTKGGGEYFITDIV